MGRKQGRRYEKPIALIRGEKDFRTEKNYFKCFNNKKYLIKFSPKGNTDPVGIVKDLIKDIHSLGKNEKDRYYAVFDTDVNKNKQEQINESKRLAKDNNIELIISNPTFELWYILHYKYTTKAYNSSSEVQEDLGQYIENYSKTMDVPFLYKKTEDAIENAKKLEKYQLELGKFLDSEDCNPYTGVYKIVEEIK